MIFYSNLGHFCETSTLGIPDDYSLLFDCAILNLMSVMVLFSLINLTCLNKPILFFPFSLKKITVSPSRSDKTCPCLCLVAKERARMSDFFVALTHTCAWYI